MLRRGEWLAVLAVVAGGAAIGLALANLGGGAAAPRAPAEAPSRPTAAPIPRPAPEPPPTPPAPRAERAAPAPEPGRPAAGTLPAALAGKHAYAGLPRADGYPHALRVLENLAYTAGYDDRRGNPAWVVYRLPADTLPQRFPRPTRFRVDERTSARIGPEVYTGSGLDRGHLAPNHAVATRFGAAAQEETFLMSNVIPQDPDLNQGPWRLLEATLADETARRCREVWVTAGPVYRGAPVSLQGRTLVPGACFMLVADELPGGGARLQAVLMPQRVARNADFRDHVTSVDEVERATGLDFFAELPDELEAELEMAAAPCWLDK